MIMTNEMIKLATEKTFIKTDCDRTASHVKGALITVASKMALESGMVSENDTMDMLIQAYELKDDDASLELIGMAPQYVKQAIGYEVDFNDEKASRAEYVAEKEVYDAYYSKVATKVQEMKSSIKENKTI